MKPRQSILLPVLLIACALPLHSVPAQVPASKPAVHATTRSDERPTQDQKLWALGMAAVLTKVNSGHQNLLGGRQPTKKSALWSRMLLREGWGVDNRTELLSALQWLKTEGHRKTFDALGSATPAQLATFGGSGDLEANNKIDIAQMYYSKLGARSIYAWDFGRYVAVCGWGYLAGYIKKDEAWQMIMPIARRSQFLFHSWKDFGEDYRIGRAFWSLDKSMDGSGYRVDRAYDYLLKSGKSPWSRIPWGLDLGQSESAMHKRAAR